MTAISGSRNYPDAGVWAISRYRDAPACCIISERIKRELTLHQPACPGKVVPEKGMWPTRQLYGLNHVCVCLALLRVFISHRRRDHE